MKAVLSLVAMVIFQTATAPRSKNVAHFSQQTDQSVGEHCGVGNKRQGINCLQGDVCKEAKVKTTLSVNGLPVLMCCPEGYTNIRSGSASVNGMSTGYCECY